MHRRYPLVLPAAIILVLLVAAPAAAQYSTFGKNKVHYEDFDWEVLTSEHVDLYYYPDERELALIRPDARAVPIPLLAAILPSSPRRYAKPDACRRHFT